MSVFPPESILGDDCVAVFVWDFCCIFLLELFNFLLALEFLHRQDFLAEFFHLGAAWEPIHIVVSLSVSPWQINLPRPESTRDSG